MKKIFSLMAVLTSVGYGQMPQMNMDSKYCDVTSAQVIRTEGKEFVCIRGMTFQGSALSVKKKDFVSKDGIVDIQLTLGTVAAGENNTFEVLVPVDESLKEIWIGSPRVIAWTKAKGMVFEKKKPIKLPPFKKI